MKKRNVLLTLLTILCVSLAALPAMAAQLFSTGGPQLPSPVGTAIGGGQVGTTDITDVSWVCQAAACDVTGMTFWVFNGSTGAVPTPTSVKWLVSGATPFNFKGGTAGTSTEIFQIGDCISGAVNWCLESISFGKSILQGHGVNWINLYQFDNNKQPGTINWSNSAACCPSDTLILNPVTNVITGYPSSLAFATFGTAVPEPSSMMLLGSGVLGMAAMLRRKLTR